MVGATALGALLGGGAGVAVWGVGPGAALGLSCGLVGGLIALVRQLSGATRAALEASASDRLRAESMVARDQAFFERLSQEFRTPLTLILAGFRALQEERETPIRVRREVASAGLRNTARLLLVLHELGALASARPGTREPRKRAVDLAALIRRVVGNFTGSGAGRSLELKGVEGPVPVEVDPNQLQTVLYAVLSSAMQRADAVTGQITVALSSSGDHVVISVVDNGGPPGPEADLDATVTQRGGAGLDLAVVREIVNAHRGKVTVSKVGNGMGVLMELPRGAPTTPQPFLDESTEVLDFLHRLARPPLPSAEDAATEESDGPLDPDRPVVLVVVQNADLRAWIRRVLGGRWAVATADDLRGARQRARELRPHMAVVDADAADGSSLSPVTDFRRDPLLCATPLLGLVSRPGGHSTPDPEGLMADDYLPLPFEEEELIARVTSLVRSRSQTEEITSLRRQLEARVEDQIRGLIQSGQLRRYLPQALLEGAIHRAADDGEQGLERRWVTVVYCAIHGFADLAERMAPEDLSRLLDAWSREVAAEAASSGGVVDQLFGDAAVMLFGAHEAAKPAEQAEAAVKGALAIVEATRALAERWHRYGLPRGLDLRVGVHTGLALVGVIGSELTSRFTAFGSPANVALRLALDTSNKGILLSLSTYALVRSQVEAPLHGNVPMEGMSRPVEAYALVALKPGAPDADKPSEEPARPQ